ncbi:MAG: cyclic nucleotide-binding domain-containing protein, partial [Cyanobacteria bacterium K_DeepCast_35m_m1_288]|nr:cyclic nucleotide-binding domain-containing protein [Cyanobacteria bacterium K_DeepCast_35m_m1_288]
MQGPPLDQLPVELLSQAEEQVQAWQLPLGEALATESAPFGFVLLLVSGSLRLSGRDAMGQEFTLRRLQPGQWWGGWSALTGVAAASCRTAAECRMLAVPVELWQQWWGQAPALGAWQAAHPQREDVYAALRPLLLQRQLQDQTLAELLDRLQPCLRSQ